MDADDLELFARSLRHATESHSDSALDAALEELGWHDALTVDTHATVSLLFELQGAANATSSALDHVLATALGRELAATTGVVLPALGGWSPPGELDGDRVAVRGVAMGALARRASALVVATTGDKHVAVEVETASLTVRPVQGIDPWLGLIEVWGEAAVTDAEPADWPSAMALAQIAVGHELAGASRRMLALAREHALDRIQFDRPIAMFQAVRHRLAETLVAIEAGAAALDAAWLEPTPQSASIAKAVNGRGARTAARHCQQVLAGIGFTTEHPLHRYIRRVLVLDELLGPARSLTRALGEDVLRTRELPPLLPL
jgi:hypothetical protein